MFNLGICSFLNNKEGLPIILEKDDTSMPSFVDLRLGSCRYGQALSELAFSEDDVVAIRQKYAAIRSELQRLTAAAAAETESVYGLVRELNLAPHHKAKIDRVENIIRGKLNTDIAWQDAYNQSTARLFRDASPEFIYFMSEAHRDAIVRNFNTSHLPEGIFVLYAGQECITCLENDSEATANPVIFGKSNANNKHLSHMIPTIHGWVDAQHNSRIFGAPMRQLDLADSDATIMLACHQTLSCAPHYSLVLVCNGKQYHLGFGKSGGRTTLWKCDFLYGKTVAGRCTASLKGFRPADVADRVTNADVILNLKELITAEASPALQLLCRKEKQHRLAYAALMLASAGPARYAHLIKELEVIRRRIPAGTLLHTATPENIYATSLLATKVAFPTIHIITANCKTLSERFLRTVQALLPLEGANCPRLGGGFDTARDKKLSLLWRVIIFLGDLLQSLQERIGEMCSTTSGWLHHVDNGYSAEDLALVEHYSS